MSNNFFIEWNRIHSIFYLYRIKYNNYTGHKLGAPTIHIKLLFHFGIEHTSLDYVFVIHVLKKTPKQYKTKNPKQPPKPSTIQNLVHI